MNQINMRQKIFSYLSLDNILPLLAVVVAVSWAWSAVGVMQRNFQFQRQVDELNQHNALMEIENRTLEYKIAYYRTAEHAEIAARDDLNKALEGEKLLIVPPSQYETENSSPLNRSAGQPLEQRSNFGQWMYFLFEQHKKAS